MHSNIPSATMNTFISLGGILWVFGAIYSHTISTYLCAPFTEENVCSIHSSPLPRACIAYKMVLKVNTKWLIRSFSTSRRPIPVPLVYQTSMAHCSCNGVCLHSIPLSSSSSSSACSCWTTSHLVFCCSAAARNTRFISNGLKHRIKLQIHPSIYCSFESEWWSWCRIERGASTRQSVIRWNRQSSARGWKLKALT